MAGGAGCAEGERTVSVVFVVCEGNVEAVIWYGNSSGNGMQYRQAARGQQDEAEKIEPLLGRWRCLMLLHGALCTAPCLRAAGPLSLGSFAQLCPPGCTGCRLPCCLAYARDLITTDTTSSCMDEMGTVRAV